MDWPSVRICFPLANFASYVHSSEPANEFRYIREEFSSPSYTFNLRLFDTGKDKTYCINVIEREPEKKSRRAFFFFFMKRSLSRSITERWLFKIHVFVTNCIKKIGPDVFIYLFLFYLCAGKPNSLPAFAVPLFYQRGRYFPTQQADPKSITTYINNTSVVLNEIDSLD